ncbi:tripartite tricarboxylate transporter permease [Candidatus Micrarchaeota archaeon]|nr:tripartite tricarboxylate transporter permease [Candidatus Micrarchaeota archaeon]
MIEKLFSIIIGFLLGAFSGFIPGIHSNTISAILMETNLDPSFLSFVIMAGLGSHTLISFVPAIFFGVPEDSTYISVLPGQKLVLEGNGLSAIKLVIISSLISIFLSLCLFPIVLILFPISFNIISPYLIFILLFASVFMILSEKEIKKIIFASAIFILAGILGILTINAPIREPLFPIFTGLFAFSTLIATLWSKPKIPKQKDEEIEFNFWVPLLAGIVLGFIADLFPGIATPAQLAVFASPLLLACPKKYLVFTSSIAVSHIIFAFASLETIGKARVGALSYVSQLIEPSLNNLFPLMFGFVISISLSAIFLLFIYKKLGKLFEINTQHLYIALILYLSILIIVISGPLGIATLVAGTAIGSLPLFLGTKRVHVMGVIIIPSILLLI